MSKSEAPKRYVEFDKLIDALKGSEILFKYPEYCEDLIQDLKENLPTITIEQEPFEVGDVIEYMGAKAEIISKAYQLKIDSQYNYVIESRLKMYNKQGINNK